MEKGVGGRREGGMVTSEQCEHSMRFEVSRDCDLLAVPLLIEGELGSEKVARKRDLIIGIEIVAASFEIISRLRIEEGILDRSFLERNFTYITN